MVTIPPYQLTHAERRKEAPSYAIAHRLPMRHRLCHRRSSIVNSHTCRGNVTDPGAVVANPFSHEPIFAIALNLVSSIR